MFLQNTRTSAKTNAAVALVMICFLTAGLNSNSERTKFRIIRYFRIFDSVTCRPTDHFMKKGCI